MSQPFEPGHYNPRQYEGRVRAAEVGGVADGIAPKFSDQYVERETQRLKGEAAWGQGFRQGLNPSDYDYRAIPHQQLISHAHDGVDPDSVDEQGEIVNDIGNAQKELSTAFTQAAAKEEAAWQGPSAEAAHGFFGELAKWADQSGESAFLAANRFSQQSTTLQQTQRNMPPPAGRSVQESMDLARQQMDNGQIFDMMGTFGDMNKQAEMQRQAHEQAAAVLTNRDQALYGAGSTQPSFAAPPQLDSTQASSAIGSPLGAPGSGIQGVQGPSVGGGPGSPLGNPGSGVPMQGPAATGAGPVQTPGYQGVSGWGRTPSTGLGPAAALGMPGPMGPGATGGDTARGGSRIGSRGAFPGGSAAGRISGFAGEGKGSSGGGKSAVGKEPLPGKGSGAAEEPGARGARGAAEAARGATGASGKGAAGSPAGAAGGGKGKEEDKEHKRPGYLQEDDPNEYFGTDGLGKTTPPVIGN